MDGRGPDNVWTTVPQRLMVFVDFMRKVGQLQHLPAPWKDLFLSEVRGGQEELIPAPLTSAFGMRPTASACPITSRSSKPWLCRHQTTNNRVRSLASPRSAAPPCGINLRPA